MLVEVSETCNKSKKNNKKSRTSDDNSSTKVPKCPMNGNELARSIETKQSKSIHSMKGHVAWPFGYEQPPIHCIIRGAPKRRIVRPTLEVISEVPPAASLSRAGRETSSALELL